MPTAQSHWIFTRRPYQRQCATLTRKWWESCIKPHSGPASDPKMHGSSRKPLIFRGFGELAGTRTQDPCIKSALLYRLSYELLRGATFNLPYRGWCGGAQLRSSRRCLVMGTTCTVVSGIWFKKSLMTDPRSSRSSRERGACPKMTCEIDSFFAKAISASPT